MLSILDDNSLLINAQNYFVLCVPNFGSFAAFNVALSLYFKLVYKVQFLEFAEKIRMFAETR